MCSLTKMSLTGQWQFWSSLLKMSLTGQWKFWPRPWWDVQSYLNCHWPVNYIFGGSTPWAEVHLYKIVIDRSMTVLKQLSKNVMERSITIFASIRNGLSQKIVIDWSMTIFWQPWSHWELLKAENHSTLWTHHLWPYVIDHSQWQKLMDKAQKSVIDPGQWQKNCHWPWSMTKKIVIDWKVSI